MVVWPLLHFHQLRWAQVLFISARVPKPDFHFSNPGIINALPGQKDRHSPLFESSHYATSLLQKTCLASLAKRNKKGLWLLFKKINKIEKGEKHKQHPVLVLQVRLHRGHKPTKALPPLPELLN